MNKITELYKTKERRDPESIKRWLALEGFNEKIISEVIQEFAERLEAGETFGYNGEISLLSQAIRERVIEITKAERSVQAFSGFSKQINGIKATLEDLRTECKGLSEKLALPPAEVKREDPAELLNILTPKFGEILDKTSEIQEQLSELKADHATLEVKLLAISNTLSELAVSISRLPTVPKLPEGADLQIAEAVWNSDLRWTFDSIVDMAKISIQGMADRVVTELRKDFSRITQPEPKSFWQRLWQ